MDKQREREVDFGCYEINKDGIIISKYYNKPLKGSIWNNDYIVGKFKLKDGTRHPILWHRVIWQYFNGDIPDGIQINHIDENKANNALSNLNLMTPAENSNYGTRNKRVSISKTNLPSMSKKVGQIDKTTGEIICIYPSIRETERLGNFDSGAVSACCKNKYMREGNNIYKNYIWKYVS